VLDILKIETHQNVLAVKPTKTFPMAMGLNIIKYDLALLFTRNT